MTKRFAALAHSLEQMETITQGHTANLKIDDGKSRYWLNRCGPEDGETHRVDVEELQNGRWVLASKMESFAATYLEED